MFRNIVIKNDRSVIGSFDVVEIKFVFHKFDKFYFLFILQNMSSDYEYEKYTMTYVIGLIRRLNRELQLKPRLSTTNTIFIHQPFNHFSSILENFINSYQLREHEGNVINDDSITAFIKRLKHQEEEEEQQQEEEEEESFEEEQQLQHVKPKLNSYNFYRPPKPKKQQLVEEEEDKQEAEQQVPIQIEENIQLARNALDKAIQLIKSNTILLKPLPPTTNKQPQRYADTRFNNENAELMEYLKRLGHRFHSKNDSFLVVNEPNDYIKAIEALLYYI